MKITKKFNLLKTNQIEFNEKITHKTGWKTIAETFYGHFFSLSRLWMSSWRNPYDKNNDVDEVTEQKRKKKKN